MGQGAGEKKVCIEGEAACAGGNWRQSVTKATYKYLTYPLSHNLYPFIHLFPFLHCFDRGGVLRNHNRTSNPPDNRPARAVRKRFTGKAYGLQVLVNAINSAFFVLKF